MVSFFEQFFEPSSPVWPIVFASILNDLLVALAALKSPIAPLTSTAGTSLQYCHNTSNVFV